MRETKFLPKVLKIIIPLHFFHKPQESAGAILSFGGDGVVVAVRGRRFATIAFTPFIFSLSFSS